MKHIVAPARASRLRRFPGASLTVAPARASRLRRFPGASLHRALALLPSLLVAACGSDALMPPPAGDTVKELVVSTPEFTLAPGEEAFRCYYTSLPADQDLSVLEFSSKMTPGSHHMILFTTDKSLAPDGTLGACVDGGTDAFVFPIPVYFAQTPENRITMPEGTALGLKKRQSVFFQMHYLNASTASITARVDLTVRHGSGQYVRAGAFASYNTKISIPAHGTQTVSGHCTVPSGSQFFLMTTHAHKRAVTTAVNRYTAAGVPGDEIVASNDWEHPMVRQWEDPYLVVPEGEEIYYTCSYRNDGDTVIRDGQSADKNEMCMAVGYYFPASRATICVDSTSITL